MIFTTDLKIRTDKILGRKEADAVREELIRKLHLKTDPSQVEVKILRRSLDARNKPELFYQYHIRVSVPGQMSFKGKNVTVTMVDPKEEERARYHFPVEGCKGELSEELRPVIIGAGPCGLFAAYELSIRGFKPIVVERGQKVEERTGTIEAFWAGKAALDPSSNVSFGEGGAGTFSDGKLNTMVKDKYGRYREVLDVFLRHGAPESIGYLAKPHIGTDCLRTVIRNMRLFMEQNGAEFLFETELTDLQVKDGVLIGLTLKDQNGERTIPCRNCVLAIGHSARDTFQMLEKKGMAMEPKAFAVGVRVAHPQSMINESQYGSGYDKRLQAADYKLTAEGVNGRGIYSFCMCPGGYVVNASSEEGYLAVNGMSYMDRGSENANSALIVTVTPRDFMAEGSALENASALSGMYYQRRLEKKAFLSAGGRIPVQLYGDFCENRISSGYGDFELCVKGSTEFADLRSVLPGEVSASLEAGMQQFDRRIKGFGRKDAIFAGLESRTSSPVRILRDEEMQSPAVKGIFPCGEGAGYAGGITSAAIDGIKVAEKIAVLLQG